MKTIKVTLWGLFLSLTTLWLITALPLPNPLTYFAFRDQFNQYTGIIAIAAMSVAMLLAVRPVWMESYMNGLDKMYRLHKWLGISALTFSVLHWWLTKGTKWMVGWGWLERPERRPPQGEGTQTLSTLENLWRSQRDIAETIGEWTFYIVAIMLALALIKRFPYHLFKKTHQWLAVIYLLLAYHAVILIKTPYWTQPIGWVMGVLLLAGSISAILVLIGRVGKKRQVQGIIQNTHYYPELQVLEFTTYIPKGWSGHKAGQFAFVTSETEAPHPFTIASAWDANTQTITFVVKELGDYTETLNNKLKPNTPITIEGPYGRFDFEGQHPRQIWVAGGIGITPFIARMKHLAQQADGKIIDLFHSTKAIDPEALAKLEADAKAANINLHVLIDDRDGLLTADKIRTAVPDWRTASIWFCGPSGFGTVLKKDFAAQGLKDNAFHQELFAMR